MKKDKVIKVDFKQNVDPIEALLEELEVYPIEVLLEELKNDSEELFKESPRVKLEGSALDITNTLLEQVDRIVEKQKRLSYYLEQLGELV